jgi:hypothetical protein
VPAIAGVVFTGGGHVSTIENPVPRPAPARRHHLARGIPAVNVLQEWIGGGNDRAAQASLLRQSDLYGRAVIAPAAAVTENPITDTLIMIRSSGSSRASGPRWSTHRMAMRIGSARPKA